MFKLIRFEERVVLDGAAIAEATSAIQSQLADAGEAASQAVDAVGDALQAVAPIAVHSAQQAKLGLDVVLVSNALDDYQQLVGAAADSSHVVIYDAQGESADDVLNRLQILALEEGQMLRSVALLSHGESGRFFLGNQLIDKASVESDAGVWAKLDSVLTQDAQLHLYSCNTAAGETGAELLKSLATATGADVFGSDDLSGRGGDWQLERASNDDSIAAVNKLLDIEQLQGYQGTLVAPAVDVNNTLSVLESQVNVTISSAELSSSDADGAPPSLIRYTVMTAPADGNLRNSNTFQAILAGNTFTQEDIDNGFIRYSHNGAENTADSFTFQVSDNFETNPTIFTFNISVTPVNDAPTVDLDPTSPNFGFLAATFTEGDGFTSITSPAGVSITDPDLTGNTIDSAVIQFTDQFINPTVPLDGADESLQIDTSGTSIVASAYDPTNGTITLTGNASFADYEQVLATLEYRNVGDEISVRDSTGSFPDNFRNVTITVTDDVGDQSAAQSIRITLVPENDDPVATAAANTTIAEQASTTLMGFVIDDPDVQTNGRDFAEFQVTLSSGTGSTLTVNTSGATVVANNGSNSVTLTGTINDINATLANGVSYNAAGLADNVTSDSVTILVNDQGNIGGGDLTDSAATIITFTPENDDPTAVAAADISIDEQGSTTLAAYVVGDPDLLPAQLDDPAFSFSVTVSSGQGALLTTGTGGNVVVSNNGTASVTLTGTITAINNALAAMAYDASGLGDTVTSDTVTLSINDQGNIGGGDLTASDSQTVSFNPVNDAPVLTVPGTQTITEDALTAIPAITLADVDVNDTANAEMVLDLSVNSGTLTVGSLGAATITGGANGSGAVQITGSLADLQNVLADISYQGNSDFTGSDTLTVMVNDQGNTGSGGFMTDTETVALNVVPANDEPVATAPADINLPEQGSTTLAAFTIADPDLTVAQQSDSNFQFSTSLTSAEGALLTVGTNPNVVVSNNGTANVTITGTVAGINSALAAVGYNGAGLGDTLASDTLTLSVNDQGNIGGGDLTDSDTQTITFTPVNDAPVLTTPGTQTIAEEATLAIPAITLSDVDVNDTANAEMVLNLSVNDGSISVAGLGTATITGGANNSDAVQITGSLSDLQNVLANISYTGDTDFTGSDTLTVVINDQGNTGSGGPMTDTETVAINVTPVNDDPTAVAPADISLAEQGSTTLAAFTVGDPDLTAAQLDDPNFQFSVTLNSSAGAELTTGVAGNVVVSNNGTSNVTLTGTITAINNALAAVGYDAAAVSDTAASDTLTLTINDQGNIGGGNLTASDTQTITYNPVNDAPILTVPGPQTATEELAQAIPAITLADVDVNDTANAEMVLDLSVDDGTLSIAGLGAATITGGANGSAAVQVTGSLADLQNVLANISYTGNTNFTGNDTLTVTVNDQGNTGSGGPMADTETVSINVTPVNDDPNAVAPADISLAEQGSTTLAAFTVGDPDLTAAQLDDPNFQFSVTLNSGEGAALTTGTAGNVVVSNNGSSNVTLTGTITAINNALAAVGYNGAAVSDTAATDTLTLTINDQGNIGGGNLTASDTQTITFTPVNDAPVLTVPGTQTVAEETAQAIPAITLADVDVNDTANAEMVLDLSVTNGTVSVAGLGAATITAGANGSAALQVTGSLSDLQNVLANINYTGNTNFTGSDTLTVTVNDQGNTGSGGPMTDTETVAINVTPVNDAPTAVAPVDISLAEQGSTTLAAFTVGDPDLTVAQLDDPNFQFSVTLSSNEGAALTTGTLGNVVVSNNGSDNVTLTGTITAINNALAAVNYNAASLSDTITSDSVTVAINDLGNIGGGNLTANDSQIITFTPVNDAPVLTVPGTQTVAEEATQAIPAITLSDVDVNDTAGAELVLDLNVNSGSLTVGSLGAATITGGANGSATLQITGTLSDLQNVLADINYTGDTNFAGSDTLTVSVNDQGNTGSGGPMTDSETIAINVTAVNDDPTAVAPADITIDEQANTTLAAFTVGDPDLSPAQLDDPSFQFSVTLSSSEGAALTTAVGGNVIVSNNGTANVTLTGTITAINNALAAVGYNASGVADATASDTLTLSINDQGNIGGGNLTASDTQTITFAPVNDAPVLTVPGTQTIAEETALAIPAITLADVDVNDTANAEMVLDLSVNDGTLTIAGLGAATITSGANGSAALQVTGSLADLQNVLSNISYTGDTNFTSSDTLTVTVNDQGNTGSGGAMSDSETVAINVTAVNDAPTAVAPADTNVDEQGSTTLAAFTVGDPDLTPAQLDDPNFSFSVTLVSSEGAELTTGTGGNVTISNNGTGSVTLSGTITAINNALASVNYNAAALADTVANDSITLTINDQGNIGGGNLTASDSQAITFNPANDAPVLGVPGAQVVNEETTLAIPTITLSDPDANDTAGAELVLELSVNNGSITVAGLGAATITNGANGSGSVQITGSLSDLQNVLANVSYQGDANFAGTDTLAVSVNDQGNTGTGGPLTDTETVSITVTAINDAPTAVAPADANVPEQGSVTLAAFTVGDPDLVAAQLDDPAFQFSVTLSSSEGAALTTGATGNVTVSNNGSANVTLSGTITAINNALAAVGYDASSLAENTVNDTITLTINDQGNIGGGNLSASDTQTLTFTPVNDAPVLTVPGTQTAAEETATAIDATLLADIDANDTAGAELVLDIVAGNGTVTVGSLGSATITAGANGSDTVQVTGSLADLQNVLADISYTGDTNFTGADTITVTVNDQGNTGSGGPMTDSEVIAVNVTPVNDAPTAVAPADISYGEQTTQTLAAFTIGDVDLTAAQLDDPTHQFTVTLNSSEGALLTTGNAGNVTVSNNGTNNVTLTGTVTAINNALAAVGYNASGLAENTAGDTITLTVNDQGNIGGGNLMGSDTQAITFTPVNDAPELTVPGTQMVVEETTLNLPAITLADIDANDTAGAELVLDLSAANGSVTVAGLGGATITSGANGSASVQVTGSLADLQNVLANISYQGNSNFAGTDTLTVSVNDQGNTGSGGPLTDTEVVAIVVTPVNDAPVANAAPDITVDEQTVNTLAAFTVSDPDLNSSQLDDPSFQFSVSVSSSEGANLTVGTGGNVTVSNNGTDNVTLTGTITAINNALAAISHDATGLAESVTSDTLTLTVNDQGNIGGGSLIGSDTQTITFERVNDAPVLTVPGTQTVVEETLQAIPAISLADVDVNDTAGAEMVLDLAAANGSITVAGLGSATITAGANGSAAVQITGSLSDLQNVLANVSYQGNVNFTGTDTITVTVNDQGNTGSGGAMSDVESIAVNVTPVNDAPNAVAPADISIDEQSVTTLSAFTVGDPDLTAAQLDDPAFQFSVTLNSMEGAELTVGTGGNLTVSNNGTGAVTLTGTITAINNALAAVGYDASGLDDTDANDTITLSINDQGNIGSGSALSASDTQTITFNPVNDAPVLTVPAPQTVTEDVAQTLDGIGLADIDANDTVGAELVLDLSVNNGTLTVSGLGAATISGGANGSDSVQITGSLSDLQNVLNNISYQGGQDFAGGDILTVTVNDQGNTGSGGAMTDTQTVAITVTPVNDPPVADPASATTPEDTAVTIALGGTDVDGTVISVTLNTLPPASEGVLTLNGNPVTTGVALTPAQAAMLVFTPALDFNGTVNFDYFVTDNSGADSTPVTAAITVTPVNDAPTVPTGTGDATTDEDTPVKVEIIGTDIDGTVETVRITTLPPASEGRFLLPNGDPVVEGADISAADAACLTFEPAENFNGDVDYIFEVIDNEGLSSGPITGTITVLDVNDPPVATDTSPSTPEDTPVAVNLGGTDVDGTVVSVTVPTLPPASQGVLTLPNGDPVQAGVPISPADAAQLTFTPAPNFNGQVDIDFIVTDDDGTSSPAATASITVTPVNDAPTVPTGTGDATTDEDTPVKVEIIGTDIDGTVEMVRITTLPPASEGRFLLPNGDPVVEGTDISAADAACLTFEPAENFNGDVDYIFEVIDNEGLSSGPVTGTITVLAVNDPPQIDTNLPVDVGNLGDTSAVDGSSLAFSDPDHSTDQLTLTILSLPQFGDLILRGENGNPDRVLAIGDTLTAEDINSGRVVYNYNVVPMNGTSFPGDDFDFEVRDPENATTGPQTFEFTASANPDSGPTDPIFFTPPDDDDRPEPPEPPVLPPPMELTPPDTGPEPDLSGLFDSALATMDELADGLSDEINFQRAVEELAAGRAVDSFGEDIVQACSILNVLDLECRINDTNDPNERLSIAQSELLGRYDNLDANEVSAETLQAMLELLESGAMVNSDDPNNRLSISQSGLIGRYNGDGANSATEPDASSVLPQSSDEILEEADANDKTGVAQGELLGRYDNVAEANPLAEPSALDR